MATIAEAHEIIAATPEEQALLFIGGHGLGKSESIRSELEAEGYRMITLFLGQAADAGDIIGLPDKVEMDFNINGTIEKRRITDFDPPKWWPFDMSDKVVIFLDEINRGKPEIMQCVMDMVLNRKLNGRDLPAHTRIIAAMNPPDDGYYQVEELDPALMDRFNVYDFNPSNSEWISWATGADVHEVVIKFIAKHADKLDPPSSKDCKPGQVYPSRRSWVRVSNILKRNEKILADRKLLQNMLMGVVGVSATSAFVSFVKELGTGLTPEMIFKKWDKKVEATVKKMGLGEVIHLNTQITMYLEEITSDLKKAIDKNKNIAYTENLQKYLESTHAEAQAAFFGEMSKCQKAKKDWPKLIFALNENLAKNFISVHQGDKL